MTAMDKPYTFDRVVRQLLSAAAVVGIILLLRHLSDVLLPFAAAVVLAYLLNPLVTHVERKTHRRGLAVGTTIGGLAIIGFALLVLVIPLVIGQVGRFREDLGSLHRDLIGTAGSDATGIGTPVPDDSPHADGAPDIAKPMSAWGFSELRLAWSQYRSDAGKVARSERFRRLLQAISGTYVGDVVLQAVEYTRTDEFNSLLMDVAKRIAVSGWSVVTFAVNAVLGLTGLIIVLLYLVFLLMDYPEYARIWPTFLPPAYREPIVEFIRQFDLALRRYFRGQFVVAGSVAVLFAIGFSSIGLPMAVPFALFVGLLNMVPYLQSIGLVPAMILAALRALEGGSSVLVSVLLVLMVFGIVQLVQDAVITPRVMGKATGLRPVAILLGVFVWGKLLGFLGLLLAIPLTCLGIAYYRRYVLLHATGSAATHS